MCLDCPRKQRNYLCFSLCIFVAFVYLIKRRQSTKMEALMEEVHLMMERDPAAKAIVFSQVGYRLLRACRHAGLYSVVLAALARVGLAVERAVPSVRWHASSSTLKIL